MDTMTLTAKPQPEAFNHCAIVGQHHSGYYDVRTDTTSHGCNNMAESEALMYNMRNRTPDPVKCAIRIYWVESVGHGYAPAEFAELLLTLSTAIE